MGVKQRREKKNYKLNARNILMIKLAWGSCILFFFCFCCCSSSFFRSIVCVVCVFFSRLNANRSVDSARKKSLKKNHKTVENVGFTSKRKFKYREFLQKIFIFFGVKIVSHVNLLIRFQSQASQKNLNKKKTKSLSITVNIKTWEKFPSSAKKWERERENKQK